MCNRFRGLWNAGPAAAKFDVIFRINFEDNPNVAPTDAVPIIALDAEKKRAARLARFGLVPRWATEAKPLPLMTNARVETVTSKPAYRDAYEKRRCIIPAEGYYEWREEDGVKQPYLFTRADDEPMALAGLWERARIGNEDILSFTILTNEPNTLAQAVHDRMPCILQAENVADWLDPARGGVGQLELFPSDQMKVRRVSRALNNPRQKDRATIDAEDEPELQAAAAG